MLDVLSKTGYKVIWRENNTGCQNNCDRVELEDFCTQKSCFDEILLTNLTEKIRSTDKDTAIVMHQTGSTARPTTLIIPGRQKSIKTPAKQKFFPAAADRNLSTPTTTRSIIPVNF